MRAAQTAAFEQFVHGRGPALLRTAYLLTGDAGHAEDLLQTSLERLARHWHKAGDDPEAWVRRTLANLATDRWRRRARRPREVAHAVPDRPGPDDGPLLVEQRQDLLRLLRLLTPRQRAVLVLRYFDDLTEPETAAVLGCSIGTVKSTASRALARLREDPACPSAVRSHQ